MLLTFRVLFLTLYPGDRLENKKNKIRSDIWNIVEEYFQARRRIESFLDFEKEIRN